MAIESKYFYTTDITSQLKQLTQHPSITLRVKDLDSIPNAMRYLTAQLARLGIKAKINKVEYIVNREIITCLHVEAK